MKKILVATDGSAPSLRAVSQGIDLAKQGGAELCFINVIEPRRMNNANREFAETELDERVRNLGKALPLMNAMTGLGPLEAVRMLDEQSHAFDLLVSDRLLSDAERDATAAGVAKVTKVSAVGDAASEIVKTASSLEPDLVVMGRRGLSAVAELLLGSVTQKVLHRLSRNVLVVS